MNPSKENIITTTNSSDSEQSEVWIEVQLLAVLEQENLKLHLAKRQDLSPSCLSVPAESTPE